VQKKERKKIRDIRRKRKKEWTVFLLLTGSLVCLPIFECVEMNLLENCCWEILGGTAGKRNNSFCAKRVIDLEFISIRTNFVFFLLWHLVQNYEV
jgi:hypothetical protein